ncbi:MAG: type 2 periplasmic-binding domain-containing protein, partial [Armatimonadota bacterium]
TEVGAICDATPSRPFADGGALIGGGAMVTTVDNLVGSPMPRHTGVVVGYCDGHAKYFPGKKPDMKDINNPISRAFFQALSYGMINNYGGAQQALATPAPTVGATTVTVGGDFPGMPLALAAADIWAQLGGKWFTRNFTGSGDATSKARAASGQYVWMIADGTGLAANQYEIARDAFVFIVSKNTKLTAVTIGGVAGINSGVGEVYNTTQPALTTATISNLFLQNSGFVDPSDPLNAGSARCAYVYNAFAGNTTYLQNVVTISIPSILTGYKGTVVSDDLEMVEKVAGDPYGIGYCSAAFADPDKVKILDVVDAATGAATHYPNNNPKYASTFPTGYNTSIDYPYRRLIKAEVKDATLEGFNFKQVMVNANFQLSPLFMTGYWYMP